MNEAGARAGVLARREQQVIANVFELDTRMGNSVMTSRDRIVWFLKNEPEAELWARIVAEPFSSYPVCDGDIDHVLSCVDAKAIFQRVLNGQPLAFEQVADQRGVDNAPGGGCHRRKLSDLQGVLSQVVVCRDAFRVAA